MDKIKISCDKCGKKILARYKIYTYLLNKQLCSACFENSGWKNQGGKKNDTGREGETRTIS